MKKKFLVVLMSLILCVATACSLVGLTSCGVGGKDSSEISIELNSKQKGKYYADINGKEYSLILREIKYTLDFGNGEKEGVYSFDGKTLTLTPDGEGLIELTFGNDEASVSYKGKNYTFLKWYEYTVSFNTNGGNDVADAVVVNGRTLNAPVPEKTGYTFDSWCTDEACANVYDLSSAVKGNMTLYAKYNAKEYSVSFNVGEGELEDTSKTVVFDSNFELPVPSSTTAGKGFVGWYTEPDGKGVQYTFGDGLNIKKWDIADNVTLYAYYDNTLKYNLINGDTQYSVEQGPGALGVTELRIPATYNGKPVALVEGSAFENCTRLTKIEIPNTIETITLGASGGNSVGSAFYGCSSLLEVIIYEVQDGVVPDSYYESTPDGVLLFHNNLTHSIELKYFPRGRQDTSYTIPSVVTTLPINVFSSAKFKEVVVPASVVSIDEKAFYSCQKLENVIFLPAGEGETESPLTIGVNAFAHNTALVSITFPGRLAAFDVNIFPYCNNLVNVNIAGDDNVGDNYASVNGILTTADKSTIVFCPKGRSGEYRVDYALIQTIGKEAFINCTKLTKLIIPAHVTTIEESAFASCTGLTDIVFEGKATNSPLTIKTKAFYGCSSLTEVTLPENLQKMEVYAFGGIVGLTKVNVECAVDQADVSYASGSFASTPDSGSGYGVSYIKTINFSKTVPVISPEGVFGSGAGYTSYITSVNVDAENPYYTSDAEGVLYDKNITSVVYYPSAKIGNYTLPSTITTIGDSVFRAKALSSIDIHAGVRTIGATAFGDCVNLENVNFLNRIATDTLVIGKQAFSGCVKIRSIALPEGTTEIGAGAFEKCSALKTLSIPSTVSVVGSSAMPLPVFSFETGLRGLPATYSATGCSIVASCLALEEITVASGNPYFTVYNGAFCAKDNSGNITQVLTVPARANIQGGSFVVPATVTYINSAAFACNESLVSCTFEEGFTATASTFGEAVFYFCSSLTSLTLPSGMTSMPNRFVAGCTSLTLINVPNTVETVGNMVFTNCVNLTDVAFDEGYENDAETLKFTSTTLNNSPFYHCDSLTNLVFPARLTNIGNYAFSNLNITSLVIPKAVIKIGTYAFSGCQHLKSLVFEDGRTAPLSLSNGTTVVMTSYMFQNCYELETIEFTEGITYIGNCCFLNCYSVRSLNFPSSLIHIGNFALEGMELLEEVTFGSEENPCSNLVEFGVSSFQWDYNIREIDLTYTSKFTKIGQNAFSNCINLEKVILPSTITTIDSNAFHSCGSLKQVEFLTNEGACSLANINGGAFGYSGIESLTIPQKVSGTTNIYSGAFEGCNSLTYVKLPSSVTNVASVFKGCPNIQTVVVESTTLKVDAPFVLNVAGTQIVASYGAVNPNADGVYTIPNGITSIGDYAFYGHNTIKKIVIPSSVTSIGNYAFSGCRNLAEIDYGSTPSVTSIGAFAFDGCEGLTSVALPSSVTTIGARLFANCTGLVEANISNIVTTSGGGKTEKGEKEEKGKEEGGSISLDSFFENCSSLKTVIIGRGLQSIASGMFYGCVSLETIKFPDSVNGDGKVDLSCVTNIVGRSFYRCMSIKEIIFPSTPGAITVGEGSFEACTSLKSVDLGGVNFGGGKEGSARSVFSSCTSLEYVSFAGSIMTEIPSIFNDCTSLTTVIFPDNVTNIGDQAFYNTGLTSIVIPDTVLTIGSSAFNSCKNLKTVVFSNGVTQIDYYLFSECSSLESITNLNGVTAISEKAFFNCSKLAELNLPNVTYLGNSVFEGCSSLTIASLPKLADLSSTNRHFYGCSSLERVEFSPNLKKVSGAVFYGCESLITSDFIEGLTTISDSAFAGCKSLTSVSLLALENGPKNLFQDCTSLESVVLPVSMRTIPAHMFDGCTSLKNVQFPTGVVTINDYAFANCGFEGDVELPVSVLSIGKGAFVGCNSMNLIIDENSAAFNMDENGLVTDNMGNVVFVPAGYSGQITLSADMVYANEVLSGCYGITSIVIADDITEIPAYAFAGLKNVVSITLPDSITEIGDGAFMGSQIETVSYASGSLEGLTAIGAYAFANCDNLTALTLPSTLVELGDYAFSGSKIKSVVIPASVTAFGLGVYEDCTSLTTIKFASGEGTISFAKYAPALAASNPTLNSNRAFAGTTAVSSVTLSSRVSELTPFMFADSGVKNITIPASVMTIGWGAFLDCKRLASVTFADRNDGNALTFTSATLTSTQQSEVARSNTGAFEGCINLKSIDLPQGTTSMPHSMFAASGLTSINVPASVNFVGNYAFAECKSLVSAKFAPVENFVEFGKGMFLDCSALEEVVLPAYMHMIGSRANYQNRIVNQLPENTFRNCTSLEEIEIPASITTIASKAFYGCTSLNSVVFPARLYSIGDDCFENCTGFENLVIPSNVTFIGQRCFAGWTDEQSITISLKSYLPMAWNAWRSECDASISYILA